MGVARSAVLGSSNGSDARKELSRRRSLGSETGGMDDVDFQTYVSRELANLPSVEAVMLGGSRARGRNIDASDWDFAIYYRNGFRTDDLRRLGWSGVVSDPPTCCVVRPTAESRLSRVTHFADGA